MTQVCFDSTNFYIALIISLAIFVYCLLDAKHSTENTTSSKTIAPLLAPLATRPPPPRNFMDYIDEARDYETNRFLQPMMPPLRRGPLNLGPGGASRRRYGYGVFNQMGYLRNPDNIDQVMPLMGRQIHSNQFEYYSFHHNNPEVKIPIKIAGDKEINDGDSVNLEAYGKPFNVKIYDLDTPRYVPW